MKTIILNIYNRCIKNNNLTFTPDVLNQFNMSSVTHTHTHTHTHRGSSTNNTPFITNSLLQNHSM